MPEEGTERSDRSPTDASPAPTELRRLLEEMVEREAADLILTAGDRPRLRVKSDLEDADWDGGKLSHSDTRRLAYSLLSDDQKKRFEQNGELDFSFGVSGLARFRGAVYRQRDAVALALRRLPLEIPSLDELGLPPGVAELTERPNGLVLVTGATGSGKSTTLAAMVDKINRERRCHVITIEDPIEFLHSHRESVIDQREVGTDTESFATALRHVLRQAPDVLLVGEMRDLETIQAALTVAETGHLTLATLHTSSAPESVNRIVDVFPAHQQGQVRAQLAMSLEGVVTQTLVPRTDGPGRVLACEVMIATPAVRASIRDDKIHQIASIMQTGRKQGMRTLNDALFGLLRKGIVSREECLRRSPDPDALRRMLEK